MYSDTSLWLSAPKRWLQQAAIAILKDWSLEMLLPRCAWWTASMEKLFHSKMDVGTAGMPPSHLPAHRLSLQPDRWHPPATFSACTQATARLSEAALVKQKAWISKNFAPAARKRAPPAH